jgi:CubicO group peptidase (beta-lactamase class C family)
MADATVEVTVNGSWEAGFEPVVDEFRRNLTDRGELGAALHLVVEDRVVVDVWGGSTASRDPRPWSADTLVTVFSCTKAATALCAHLLADRGELDLDAPLADIWPELPAARQGATGRMALDHSLGLPAVRHDLPAGTCTDWDAMIAALEATEPWWEPGTRNGYHMITFGWTVGEVVRRVSGRSLGAYFRDEIAGPRGLDFFIGLPEAEHGRMARISPWRPEPGHRSTFTDAVLADPAGIPALALLNSGGFNANDPAVWSAEIGGAGGTASARGLAGMYRPLAAGGGDLLSPEATARMASVAGASAVDATLRIGTRFGLGVMRSMDNRRSAEGAQDSAVIGRHAYGHVGAGGSIGFADPECGLAFGYVMNQQGAGILLNERGQSLVDATYRVLGYRTNSPGAWIR